MLKNSEERIILNDYIENDPLSEENLDKTLKYLHEIRLLSPKKTTWIYSGFRWEQLFTLQTVNNLTVETIKTNRDIVFKDDNKSKILRKRRDIISLCDVMIDGQYIDSERDITLKFKGSKNQRVIDVKKSLEQNKVVLWEN